MATSAANGFGGGSANSMASVALASMAPIQHTEIFGTGNTFDGDMLIGLPPPVVVKGVPTSSGVHVPPHLIMNGLPHVYTRCQTRSRHTSYSHSRGSSRSRSPERRTKSPSCQSCSSSGTQRSRTSSHVDSISRSRSPLPTAHQGSSVATPVSSLLSMRRGPAGGSRYRSQRTVGHRRHHSHFQPHFEEMPIHTGTRRQHMSQQHIGRPSSRSRSLRRALSPTSSCGPYEHDKRRKVSAIGDRRRSIHSPSASPAPGSDGGPPPLQPGSPAAVFDDDVHMSYDMGMDGKSTLSSVQCTIVSFASIFLSH